MTDFLPTLDRQRLDDTLLRVLRLGMKTDLHLQYVADANGLTLDEVKGRLEELRANRLQGV